MDREVLERLATDRALGALTPDVERLLEAYLRLDSPSAAAAGEIERTVELARASLGEKQPSSMPAFPVAGFMQIERWHRRVRQVTYGVGLAACLVLGIALGRLAVPATDGQAKPGYGPTILASKDGGLGVVSPQTNGLPPLAKSETQDAGGFWSVQRLRQQREQDQVAPANGSEPAIRIQWPTWNRPT